MRDRVRSRRGGLRFAPTRPRPPHEHRDRHDELCRLQESGAGLGLGELTELIDLRIERGLATSLRSFGGR
jgi:hypothetical protein